jgi:hypothetical protein
MNLMTRSLGLVTLSAGVLVVNGTTQRGAAHAQTADHSSPTDTGETTQTKIARATSAGPTDMAKSARLIDTNARGIVVLREGKTVSHGHRRQDRHWARAHRSGGVRPRDR